MASPVCTNATVARAGLPHPRHRPPPSASAPVTRLRLCSLPKRGLRCAGADWPEPAFVAVAEKLDAARKARATAGAGSEDGKGRTGAINGVGGSAVEEPVEMPFAPFEQSLVPVDSVGDDALSQALGSKLGFEEALLDGFCLLLSQQSIPSPCSQSYWKSWALATQFGSAHGIFFSRKTGMNCLSKLKNSKEGLLDPAMSDMLARDWALAGS